MNLWAGILPVLLCGATAPAQPEPADLPALVPLSGQRLGQAVQFRHRPQRSSTRQVSVIGDFNGWDVGATPLAGPDADGWFSTAVRLPPGRHLYKFVEDGVRYLEDPSASAFEPDGFTGRNSVLVVEPPLLPPAELGDGRVDAARIVHHCGRPACLTHRDGGVEVRLITRAHDVERVRAHWIGGPDFPLIHLGDEGEEAIWAGELPPPRGARQYRFEVADGACTLQVGARGSSAVAAAVGVFAAPPLRLENLPPAWVRDAVFYQIFPERFANGDPSNDPPATEPWGSVPGHYTYQGGDLRGITQHLDYLQELGIDALYLNPIFVSPSNHKYDTADYTRVDPHFGGDAAFDELLTALKKRDMRILLDGVFNHTGNLHPAFQDLRRRGPESDFADWYQVRGFPVASPEAPNYAAWNGYGHLPELCTWNPEVRRFLFDIAARWIRRGIDGWRLDAAEQVEHEFWREFRDRARAAGAATGNEPYLLGEIWGDARPWLDGEQFDGVTNYQLRVACVDFFAKESIDAAAFAERLQTLLRRHPKVVTESMVNLLGSHDTPRWRTVCGERAARARLGTAFLLTWPGAPLIYYGDEIGMSGGPDPGNRAAFDWRAVFGEQPQLRWVRRVIQVRHSTPALRDGLVRIAFAESGGGLLYMERSALGEPVGVVLNRGCERRNLRLPSQLPAGRWWDAISGVPARVEAGVLSIATLGEDQLLVLRRQPSPMRRER